jgi:putative phosphoribosyl transferase
MDVQPTISISRWSCTAPPTVVVTGVSYGSLRCSTVLRRRNARYTMGRAPDLAIGDAMIEELSVRIDEGRVGLDGDLLMPEDARGVVLFAHGSGSGRSSPRNRFVARHLNGMSLTTLLLDLLTAEEEQTERLTRHLRFDIGLLARRLMAVTDWLKAESSTAALPVGYFGASTGGAAALVAAAERPDHVAAVVSRGGRPDLAGESLARVRAPTLLIVGGKDEPVIAMNGWALERLKAPEKQLVTIPGATHLFEEPGTLEEVARLAGEWFSNFLTTNEPVIQ